MSRLKELVKKRKEIGKTVITADHKQNHNNKMEHERYKDLIIKEVYRMYEAGELNWNLAEEAGNEEIIDNYCV